MRQILHVDMDAFYASVEERDDPSLRGKPLIVGGRSRRGVVSAASYAVRKYGVHSAMPMAEALRLCPHAICVDPRMGRYSEVSGQVFEIFRRYTPLVQGLSLDEAFLDVTASQSLFGDGAAIAQRIKDDIRGELSLTASAGVARSKFVAKVASDLKKPDGLVVVPEDVAAFLAPLPIERMWGIGVKTAPRLRALGYATFGDFARAPEKDLERTLGIWGLQVGRLARGEDDREVDPELLAKSVGAEMTYERDLTTREEIERTLLDHAQRVAQRLVDGGLSARVVVVKLKYADFQLLSRRTTLREPVMDATSIHEAARVLLRDFPARSQGVRLTGVSVAKLMDGPPPRLLIGGEEAERRRKVEEVMAKVKGKFGIEGLTRATLLEREENVGGVSASIQANEGPRKKPGG
ncbi:MAG TPA: DNA polymerase IV [Polyangiaceae bacterium]